MEMLLIALSGISSRFNHKYAVGSMQSAVKTENIQNKKEGRNEIYS